jgi:putative sterol carrier protein
VPEFPSDPWVKAFVERINGSVEYAASAAGWEGDVAIVIEAEPDRGVPETAWVLLELLDGACRGGGVVDEERGTRAPFVIRASYSRWKDVIRGDLDPIKAMMQGKLKVQGDLPMIIRYARATNELAHLTQLVDTSFPDES